MKPSLRLRRLSKPPIALRARSTQRRRQRQLSRVATKDLRPLDLPRLPPRPVRPLPGQPIIHSSLLMRPVPVQQAPVALAQQPHVQAITRTALLVGRVRLLALADLVPPPDPVVPAVPEVEALVAPAVVPVEYDPALLHVHVQMVPALAVPEVPVVPVVPVPSLPAEVHAPALRAAALQRAAALLVEHPVVPAVLVVPAAAELVAVALQVHSVSKAESRVRRARARKCVVKSSTICKPPSWVASSSLVVMAQPRFACLVAHR